MSKTYFKLFLTVIIIASLSLTSCNKNEGCTDSTAINYDIEATEDDGSCEFLEEDEASIPDNFQVQITDADAILVALQTVTYSEIAGFPIETAIGLPIAWFPNNGSTTDFLDVGTVSCESNELNRFDNNSYVFTPSATSPLGTTYSGTIDWSVSGGSGFPGFDHSSNATFPSNTEISVPASTMLNTSEAFTLSSVGIIQDADSVVFAIFGVNNTLLVTKANSNSHTFTGEEMETLGTGAGYIQLTAFRIAEEQTLGTGEKIYYLNQKTNQITVTFE